MNKIKLFTFSCCVVFLLPLLSTPSVEADSPRVTFYFRGGKGIHVFVINLEKHDLVDVHWTIQLFDHGTEKKNVSGTIDRLASKGSVKIATGSFSLPLGEYDYGFMLDPPGEWDEIGAVDPSWVIGNWIFLRPFLAPIPPAT